jgi:hypothetical protein
MKYSLLSPERNFEHHLDLGDDKDSVVVVGDFGSGKTLVASTLFITASGEPKTPKQTLRGKFPVAVWLGEGATSELVYNDNEKTEVVYYPYDMDNVPNFMTYTSTKQIPTACALATGHLVYASNLGTLLLQMKSEHYANFVGFMSNYVPGMRINPAEVNASLAYINKLYPPVASTIGKLFSIYLVVSSAHLAILDVTNPGISDLQWACFHEGLTLLAKQRSIKLITFNQKHRSENALYSRMCFL